MPETMDGLSMNLEQANLDKLRAAFPDCFTEGILRDRGVELKLV